MLVGLGQLLGLYQIAFRAVDGRLSGTGWLLVPVFRRIKSSHGGMAGAKEETARVPCGRRRRVRPWWVSQGSDVKKEQERERQNDRVSAGGRDGFAGGRGKRV